MLYVQVVKFNKVQSSVEMKHAFVISATAVGGGNILWILTKAISLWCVTRQTVKSTRSLCTCISFESTCQLFFPPLFNVCSLEYVFNTPGRSSFAVQRDFHCWCNVLKMFDHTTSDEVFYVNTSVVQSSFYARILLTVRKWRDILCFNCDEKSLKDFLTAFLVLLRRACLMG